MIDGAVSCESEIICVYPISHDPSLCVTRAQPASDKRNNERLSFFLNKFEAFAWNGWLQLTLFLAARKIV
jgi:hypothetical protein